MKKSAFQYLPRDSAEFTAGHNAWRRSRGKRPSLQFADARNPRAAAKLAQRAANYAIAERARELSRVHRLGVFSISPYGDEYALDITPDEDLPREQFYDSLDDWLMHDLDSAIKVIGAFVKAQLLVTFLGKPHWFTVHMVNIFVQADSDLEKLAWEWRVKNTAASQEYRLGAIDRTKRAQRKAAKHMHKLAALDFSDVRRPLTFLHVVALLSDRGASFDGELIVNTYNTHGFVANAETTENPSDEQVAALLANRERYARYLIGQGLDGLTPGSWGINPRMMSYHTHQWMKLHG